MPARAPARKPQFTNTNSNGTTYYVTPGDFAIIYDATSVYTGGNKGGGSVTTHGVSKANSVAIIGQSRVALTDISEFAANTGIGSSYTLNTIIPGTGVDPGVVCTFANANTCSTGGDQGEQTLDVDRVVGNAPAVTADLVVSSAASGGIQTAAQWNVSNQVDPVMTISYGGCEAQTGGQTAVNTWNTIYMTAAAEGISTFVSSGDSAANGCAPAFTSTTTTRTASINFLCASSYVTCVGGTEFIDPSPSTYWNATNSTGMRICESPTSQKAHGTSLQVAIRAHSAQAAPEAAPAWRSTNLAGRRAPECRPMAIATRPMWPTRLPVTIPTMLAWITRSANIPQGITSADNCTAAGGGYFFGFSGTSAAAPSMAGVTALLNSKLGAAQGNLNPLLYTLAATPSNNVFHDITVTSSGVTGCVITVPSMCNNSTPGASANSTTATGGLQGYLVTAGYDEVTGLGSIDVANFLAAATPTTISTTLAVTATTSPISAGQSDTFTATLTRSSTTPGAATGTVQFYNNGGSPRFGSAVTISNNVAVSAAQTFPSTGTYAITAVYSGDSNYTTSASPAVSLVVNAAPSFSVTPATTAYSLISGVTTGNTDLITFASVNSFVGGGHDLHRHQHQRNCGGHLRHGARFGPADLRRHRYQHADHHHHSRNLRRPQCHRDGHQRHDGRQLLRHHCQSDGVLVHDGGRAACYQHHIRCDHRQYQRDHSHLGQRLCGNSHSDLHRHQDQRNCCRLLRCLTGLGYAHRQRPGITGTTTVTLTSTAGTAGVLSLAVSGSGAPTGGTIAATASIPTPITATLVTPSFTMSAPATISLAANATTGNTVSVTLTSVNGFVGTVTVGCVSTLTTLTNCSGGSAVLASGGTATATVTVSPVLHNSGSASLTVSGTGTSAGLTTAYTATPVTVTANITTVASTTTVVAAPTTVAW